MGSIGCGFVAVGPQPITDGAQSIKREPGGMLAYFYMHDMSWGWGILMMIGWIAVWSLIIWGAIGIWRDRTPDRSARETLDRRLAAGEISVEEYERLRRAMTGKPVDQGPGAVPSAPA